MNVLVPKELVVVVGERDRGLYTTSAFCLSKTVAELPVVSIQACVFMCIIYWVANLNNTGAMVASVGVVIINVATAQVGYC